MEPSGFFRCDDSLWPFVMVRMRGLPTSEEYARYLESLTHYLHRPECQLILVDMLQVRLTTTEPLHRQAEWSARHEALLRERSLGIGFVMDACFMRLGLSVSFYLHPPVAPYLVAPHLGVALEWGVQRLEAAGLFTCAARVRERHGLSTERRAG